MDLAASHEPPRCGPRDRTSIAPPRTHDGHDVRAIALCAQLVRGRSDAAFVSLIENVTTKHIMADGQSADPLLFFKEVTKYFMDFLETDFHKRRFPRRTVKSRNADNLLIGLNLQKYPSFNRLVWQLITKNFDRTVLNKVDKGVFKTTLPKNLLDLVNLQIGGITGEQISALNQIIALELERAAALHKKEYDLALTSTIATAEKNIRAELIKPFIESIERPLQNLNLGDDDDLYLIEEELIAILVQQLESKVSELLRRLIVREQVSLAGELESVFNVEGIRRNLSTYFDNLQVADLFAELFEMDRNKGILDKQDFYLYFGDISFKNTKYPIFYIPVAVSRREETMYLDFDSQIYINKRALEYIVQEHNALKETKGTLRSTGERIIYLAQHATDLQDVLSRMLTEITNFFETNNNVNFSGLASMTARGATVRITNSCYLCLFDRSDEALVNDYEEILQQLGTDDGLLSKAFHTLLEDFISKNPEPYNPDIEEAWDDLDTSEKLVSPSPIPLNSEQLQILAAVKKEGCKYIIVEGPPGTGKSHTITAIVFDAVLRNQSVLVLSDKKEALDVVEKNITQIMNKVRSDKEFQNPILRLGKIGNTYSQILAKSSIEAINDHFKAVKKDHEMIEQNITKSVNSLKEDIEAEIIAYDDISLQEIKEFYQLENYLKNAKSIFDAEELLSQNRSSIELAELRTSLIQVREIFKGELISDLLALLGSSRQQIAAIGDYEYLLLFLGDVLESAKKVRDQFKGNIVSIGKFNKFCRRDIDLLAGFIREFSEQKLFLVGYLFSKSRVQDIDERFGKTFQTAYLSPHQSLEQLRQIYRLFNYVNGLGSNAGAPNYQLDFVAIMHRVLSNPNYAGFLSQIIATGKAIEHLKRIASKFPKTLRAAGINLQKFASVLDNRLVQPPKRILTNKLISWHSNKR